MPIQANKYCKVNWLVKRKKVKIYKRKKKRKKPQRNLVEAFMEHDTMKSNEVIQDLGVNIGHFFFLWYPLHQGMHFYRSHVTFPFVSLLSIAVKMENMNGNPVEEKNIEFRWIQHDISRRWWERKSPICILGSMIWKPYSSFNSWVFIICLLLYACLGLI